MGRAAAFKLVPVRQGEHDLQVDCTTMLHRLLLPSVAWTAIDHAHSLNMTIGRHGRPIGLMEAAKRKARGVKAGISDYLFWHRSYAFAIEMKAEDGVLSDDQKVFLTSLIDNDVEVSVCWTLDHVFERVTAWGLTRATVLT